MLKIYLLTASILLASLPGLAAPEVSSRMDEAVVEQTLPEGQSKVFADTVQSETVPYVEESATARKMSQAEKAHNAAVNDSWGGAITIVAMVIVISALAVLSLLFLGFGKVSASLIAHKSRKTKGLSKEQAAATGHDDLASGEAIAAIGMALAEHFGDQHDMEDTIITIRRLKKAYSPWNSKIYNLRQTPELHRNVHPKNAI